MSALMNFALMVARLRTGGRLVMSLAAASAVLVFLCANPAARAASVQPLDCWRANVEEMGAGNGQARAQAGADFQTHRRFRKQP